MHTAVMNPDGAVYNLLTRIPAALREFSAPALIAAGETSGAALLSRRERLAQAFAKYERMQRHFAGGAAADLRALAERLARPPTAPTPAWRERVVGCRGAQFFTVPVAQVAYFVSDGKLSFMVTREARRYLVDGPLADIERDLDPRGFFRVNRQYLVNATAIVRFAAAGRGRLDLELSPRADGEVRVSQERAGAFRAWVGR